MIILVWNKCIQSAVDSVILAGFDLKRNGGKAFLIIYQIIHLSLASVVVVEQLAAVRDQLACNNTFINGAVFYASIRASILRKKHIQAYLFWLFNIITALNNQLFNVLLYTENSLYTDLIQQFIKSLLHMGVVPLYPWTLAYLIMIYRQKKKNFSSSRSYKGTIPVESNLLINCWIRSV